MLCFNPRTYIRYDDHIVPCSAFDLMFQSTYLYKVRREGLYRGADGGLMFQSTYLYKVRLHYK